jgi:hypothetical protein
MYGDLYRIDGPAYTEWYENGNIKLEEIHVNRSK